MDIDLLKKKSPLPFYHEGDVIFGEKIGEGGNSSVYEGKIKDICCVIKCVEVSSEHYFDLELYELNVASHLNNTKQVIKTYGFSYYSEDDTNYYLLLMELLTKHGDLYDYIQNKPTWTSSRVYNNVMIPKPNNDYVYYNSDDNIYWCYEMDLQQKSEIVMSFTTALYELHQKRVLHGDIKTNNLIIYHENNHPIVKIIDLGMVSFKKSNKLISIQVRYGTKGYRAPEQENFQLHYKSDVYSWGVTVIEIWNGDIWSIDSDDSFKSNRRDVLNKLKVIEKNHPLFGKLLRDSINMNVDKRPYMDTVLKRLKKISFTHDHK